MKAWTVDELIKQKHNAKEHDEAMEKITPLLANKPPQAQGAILADLTAIWLAGWTPELREPNLNLLVELIRTLAEGNPGRNQGSGN